MDSATGSRIELIQVWTAVACVLFPCAGLSQSFRSAAECEHALKQLQAQANYWDSAFMDCAAGAAKYQVHDCRAIASDSPRFRAAFSADAAKRDTYIAQVKAIQPVCDQLRAAERQRERQEAIDRSRAQQAQQQAQEQERRRTQLSLQQYNDARIAEARNLGDNNRRYEELRRQQPAQQQATQKAEAERQAARQAAVRSQQLTNAKAALAEQSISALRSLAGIPDPPGNPTTDQYKYIQRGVQKLHEGIQENQSGIVSEIQNYAWSKLEESNTERLNQVEDLKRTIDAISAETSTPVPAAAPIVTLRSSTLPVGTAKGVDTELEQVGSGAYGTRAPQPEQIITMASTNSHSSSPSAESINCDGSQTASTKATTYPHTGLSQSQLCVAGQQMADERKQALAEATRCNRTAEAAAIQRQLKNIDRQLKQACH